MKKILISVEGQTEEQFVERVLQPLFPSEQCFLQPIVLTTRRDPSGRTYKGGIVSYARIHAEVKRLLGDTSADAVTTMYDYYGLPDDFPGKDTLKPSWSPYEKVRHLECAFAKDINDPRFIPYLSLHEFEALLLADIPQVIQYLKQTYGTVRTKLLQHLSQSPEAVDENEPPSHRLQEACRSYSKLADGLLLAERIEIQTMRSRCPHFNDWVLQLQSKCSDC
ncbi:hypothetical protein HRbin15_02563 [bacterium HR15]|nr:hypothetical protein HRbin15_02563 [bacterium HR15]